jgi:hypothetical protein
VASVRARVDAGVIAVLVLFIGVVVTQFVVSDSLQSRHERRVARVEAARDANTAVLQHMTDAETGVRGFQLTGDKSFLEPYDQGRIGAFTSFDEVAARTTDPTVLRLLTAERAAASRWLYVFAYPVVNAGVAKGFIGWALDRTEREALLTRFPPRYATAVADHVTLKFGDAEAKLPTATSGEIVGEADDGQGVQAMVVRIGGTTDRPDGSTYHITWSLAPGRQAKESNDAIRECGWTPLPEPVAIVLQPKGYA